MQDNRFLIRERGTDKVLGCVHCPHKHKKEDVQEYIDSFIAFFESIGEKNITQAVMRCVKTKYSYYRVPILEDYTDENTVYC